MVANQTTQIGPNQRPTPPEPRRWTMNSATSRTSAMGAT